jgi:FtsP/CotA-like multicopper oxidase with cupredoxin domain
VYDLVTKVVDWEVEPGKFVKAWTYNGVVPAPTIKLNVGDKVRINQKNELPESTALHIHGYVGPNAVDGVPPITQKEIKPGDSFTYEFVVDKPIVAMYHSHHNAQTQVPNGMAGAFLVGEVPRPAGIPEPVWKEVMFLNDAGTIGLALNGKSFPATTPYVAKLGDWIQMTYFNEGLQFHPMHLHGPEQLVVQVDNQMLTAPYWTDTVIVAPGQRMTVLVKADNPGVWAWHCHILNHAEGPQGMFGMVTALIIEDPNATT